MIHVYPLAAPTCSATVDTKGTTVRCGKKPDGHDTHLGRHDGWDVIW